MIIKQRRTVKKRSLFMLLSRPAWAGLGLIAVSGCAVIAQTGSEPAQWRLVAATLVDEPDGSGGFSGTPVIVRLVDTRAASAIDRRDMAYSRAPQSIGYYRDNRWASSPAVMLNEVIDETLSAQPWVRGIVRGGARITTDLALYCEIERLEHQVDGASGYAQLKVGCSWYRGDGQALLDTLRFDQSVALKRNDARYYAAATQELVDDLLKALNRQGRALATGKSGPQESRLTAPAARTAALSAYSLGR